MYLYEYYLSHYYIPYTYFCRWELGYYFLRGRGGGGGEIGRHEGPVLLTDITQACRWDSPNFLFCRSRKENPQKLTQLSPRSHPRHLVGKRTAKKDTIIDITSDSQVNSNFPNRWSPASLTFNNYFYLFLYLYIT